MGHHCNSIAVKHAFDALQPSTLGEPNWEAIVANLELWAEMQEDQVYPAAWTPPAWYTNAKDAELGYGWIVKRTNTGFGCGWEQEYEVQDGRKNSIYVTAIRKDDKLVFGLNSSEYCHVGETEMTYFSDNKAHLQEFVNDFFPGGTCVSKATVQQWG